MQQPFHCFLLMITIIYSHFLSTAAQPLYLPLAANISTKWINNLSIQPRPYYYGVKVRSILVRETSGPAFSCGFISSGSLTSFLFSIYIGDLNYNATNTQIVWSANRERLVGENATLQFFKNGELILRDFDGTHIWSTNTSGRSVVRMYLNEVGSLVLSDIKNNTVWSSIDYPTDSLVLGQTLRQGQRLTANISVTNSSQGPYYLTIKDGFQAFVGSNPPQLYYDNTYLSGLEEKPIYVSFNNGSLDVFTGSNNFSIVPLPLANSVQYMRLDYEGHLRIYEWATFNDRWVLLSDVLDLDECAYPTVCGKYGICFNGQCTCPFTVNDSLNYFKPVDQRYPNVGCMPSTAISCKSNKTQEFLLLPNVSFFNYIDYKAAYMDNTNAEVCKQACLVNCSCKAALFAYNLDASSGNCFLPSELYSLTYNNLGYNSSAFIKVQSFPITNLVPGSNFSSFSKSKKVSSGVIVAASVGSLLAFFLVVVCIIALIRRRNMYREVEDDDEFNMLSGLPTRFTFEDLRVATNDFLRKLGEGGFGSVFEGTLIDGTKIAVKRLDSVGQGKKEFLAEVKTIGSIHHIHLVRLVGFCAEKSYRLLIYEYMSNGSLDKWIFYKNHHNIVIDWQTRRKIIIGIARGLAYLHEECRQKIVHLDIKPQNILLNENFDAKVSDFGLAKLIDRDQIEVMTRMRGTPGYLAPEWLTSVITEKVDVFSFGVVVLEIVCGRRNLDYSKDEESVHLISLLQQKVAENKLVDIIDCRSTDMQLNIEDVTMVMHLAMWCLQSDRNKRPCMSVVLKVLEGSMNVEANLDYNFSNLAPYVSRNVNIVESVLPIASILSGPR